jgi:hypothetical protein
VLIGIGTAALFQVQHRSALQHRDAQRQQLAARELRLARPRTPAAVIVRVGPILAPAAVVNVPPKRFAARAVMQVYPPRHQLVLDGGQELTTQHGQVAGDELGVRRTSRHPVQSP